MKKRKNNNINLNNRYNNRRNVVLEENGDLKILENCWSDFSYSAMLNKDFLTTFQIYWGQELNIPKIHFFIGISV